MLRRWSRPARFRLRCSRWCGSTTAASGASPRTATAAIAACTQAIQSGRFSGAELASIYDNRAIELRQQGEFDRAIADYTAAIRIDAELTGAYTGRGLAYEGKAEAEKAKADYRKALTLAQKYDDGAWAHETARGRLQALGRARRVDLAAGATCLGAASPALRRCALPSRATKVKVVLGKSRGVMEAMLRGDRRPPVPARGGRRPNPLRLQPWVSLGTAAVVTHDRTVAWSPIARARQVTVANIICGVDVSSQVLDARIGFDGAAWRFERTAEGIAALADFCRQHAVELVAMEVTGGYEKLPFMLLRAAGVPSAIVNPRSVRRFAEGMGLLEKTDRIDCGVIAWYAAVKRIVPREQPAEAQQRLTALVCRLEQLTELPVMQMNQRRLICDADAIGSIDAIVALVRNQIRQFEDAIAELITADPLSRALDQAFRTIKGVADRTVARLMADLPEISTLTNKASANWLELLLSPRTPGKSSANAMFAAVAEASAISSSSLPRSSDGTIRTSATSIAS